MAKKKKAREITAKEMFNRIIVVAELLSKSDVAKSQTIRRDMVVQKTQNR